MMFLVEVGSNNINCFCFQLHRLTFKQFSYIEDSVRPNETITLQIGYCLNCFSFYSITIYQALYQLYS